MRYDRIMKRTTIVLPDDIDTQLRYEAKRRGVSMTELAREAITAYLVEPADQRRRDLSFFDLGEGDVDSASNLDHYVAEAIERRHRER
jgi:predicted DNA-binding protein